MEKWRDTWRRGFAPGFSVEELRSLRKALAEDDPRLQQGAITWPPPLIALVSVSPQHACAVGFCGWMGRGLQTIEEVDRYFGRVCQESDERMDDPACCRWFLNWFDETPREEMRRELLGEVELALQLKGEKLPIP